MAPEQLCQPTLGRYSGRWRPIIASAITATVADPLVTGVHAVLLRYKPARLDPWLIGLLRRRPRMVVAVAIANKMARIAWAIVSQGVGYRSTATA